MSPFMISQITVAQWNWRWNCFTLLLSTNARNVYVKCVFCECDKGVRTRTKLFVQEIVWYGNSTSVSRDDNVRESCCLPWMLHASGTTYVDHVLIIIKTIIYIGTCRQHGWYMQNKVSFGFLNHFSTLDTKSKKILNKKIQPLEYKEPPKPTAHCKLKKQYFKPSKI